MKQFRLVDNIVGWLAFFIAAFVYCSTIEPTASFWDCPEFITTGYKLEIGHPPGAPFFMLTANLFSHFAYRNFKILVVLFSTYCAVGKHHWCELLTPMGWSTFHLAISCQIGLER